MCVRGVPATSCPSVQRATSPAPPCDPEFGKIHTLSEELRSKVYICILEGVRFSCQFSAEEKQQNGAKSKNPDALYGDGLTQSSMGMKETEAAHSMAGVLFLGRERTAATTNFICNGKNPDINKREAKGENATACEM